MRLTAGRSLAKRRAESVLFALDFSTWLQAGETIAGPVAVVFRDGQDVTTDFGALQPQVAGGTVKFRLAAAQQESAQVVAEHVVRITVTTSLPQTLIGEVVLRVLS